MRVHGPNARRIDRWIGKIVIAALGVIAAIKGFALAPTATPYHHHRAIRFGFNHKISLIFDKRRIEPHGFLGGCNLFIALKIFHIARNRSAHQGLYAGDVAFLCDAVGERRFRHLVQRMVPASLAIAILYNKNAARQGGVCTSIISDD